MLDDVILRALPYAFAAAAGAFIMHDYDQKKYDSLRSEYDRFKGGVEAVGREADAKNAKIALADIKQKERADEEHARKTAAARSTIDALRLRLDAERDSRGGFVPAAPAGSKCPDGLACYDRAELERTLREHREEVRRLADESAAVERALNTAKAWAQR